MNTPIKDGKRALEALPIEIFYPYQAAITILAQAPLDQDFTVTVQPSAPRLGIPGPLQQLDQTLPLERAACRRYTPAQAQAALGLDTPTQ